ncbi:MAG TPA: response regulator [Verrucomicrobiae bacterium]
MNNANENQKRRILVIDDNPSIHADVRKILGGRGERNAAIDNAKAILFDDAPEAEVNSTEFEIDSAYQGEEGLDKVKVAVESGAPYSMAFVDVRMPPGWDGVETITHIWKAYPELQVVVCTAYSDYSWQEMIQQLGKTDGLVILKKPFDNIEVLQLAHALTEKWRLSKEIRGRLQNLDVLVTERTVELRSANERLTKEIAERVLLESALRLSEERFSKAFKASPIPLAIQSLQHEKYLDTNEGFQLLTGYGRDELLGRAPLELNIWDDPKESTVMLKMLRDRLSVRNMPCQLRTKAQQVRQVLLSAELLDLGGEPFLLTIAQDITEQLIMEGQLRQAHKMEAVGQLAAGVAHDFNNMLTVIQGHTCILRDDCREESAEFKSLQTVSDTAEKAAKLVRQLLAFSRKQVTQMRPLAMHEVICGIAGMLTPLLGEKITLKMIDSPSSLRIVADRGMLEQMVINCAVNARDAMPEGGVLTLSAEVVDIDSAAACRNQDARPGQFMRLSVADTGHGIKPELQARIFEPFFTTKPVGKATGLGLAAVYGIAKQHSGWVEVESQPGRGATFHIFLPACAAPDSGPRPARAHAPQGHESVLVVDDDDDVRDYIVEVLNSRGYHVADANSGKAALERWNENGEAIDLLLTDMVMPGGLTGRQLADSLLAKDPALRVLYTSGYNAGMAGEELSRLVGHDFLPKPYEPDVLLKAVRTCLDRPIRGPRRTTPQAMVS